VDLVTQSFCVFFPLRDFLDFPFQLASFFLRSPFTYLSFSFGLFSPPHPADTDLPPSMDEFSATRKIWSSTPSHLSLVFFSFLTGLFFVPFPSWSIFFLFRCFGSALNPYALMVCCKYWLNYLSMRSCFEWNSLFPLLSPPFFFPPQARFTWGPVFPITPPPSGCD